MLKNLFHAISIYRIKSKMQMLQSQIKQIESLRYINLQTRIELSRLKKMLMNLHEHETSLHHSNFIISGFQEH